MTQDLMGKADIGNRELWYGLMGIVHRLLNMTTKSPMKGGWGRDYRHSRGKPQKFKRTKVGTWNTALCVWEGHTC